MSYDLQVMSPKDPKTGASTEEPNAALARTQVPAEDERMRTLASPQADAALASSPATLEQTSEHQEGFPSRTLPKHDSIRVVFEEFLHDHDLPIHDPTKMQELAIENPKDYRYTKYLNAYHQLDAEMKAKVPKIATPY